MAQARRAAVVLGLPQKLTDESVKVSKLVIFLIY